MKSSSQSRFPGAEFKAHDQFGGSLSNLRRCRKARPVSTKENDAFGFKSSLAKGRFSFRADRNFAKIESIIKSNCEKYGVKLIRWSNNFNHLHLHVKFTSRELYKRFVRSVAGHIAMVVTGANKTKALSEIIGRARFWDYRPFSRIVRGRRGFKTANDYVRLNQLEANDVIPKRTERLRGVRDSEALLFTQVKPTRGPLSSPQLSFESN